MEKITQDYSSDTLIAEEESKIILAYKYAEIARNEAEKLTKQNQLIDFGRLKNMTDLQATALESLNEFADAHEIRQINVSL